MLPTTSPATSTLACRTRCTIVITRRGYAGCGPRTSFAGGRQAVRTWIFVGCDSGVFGTDTVSTPFW